MTTIEIQFNNRQAYGKFLDVGDILKGMVPTLHDPKYKIDMKKKTDLGEGTSSGRFSYNSDSELPEEGELLRLLERLNVVRVNIH